MTTYIDPLNPDWKVLIASIKRTPGYCFFIDIVGSTELKNENLDEWIITFYNTFAKVRSDLYSKFRPIKSLGDALMFFIPEENIRDESPLTLFAGLRSMIDISNEEKKYFSNVKIAAAFCDDAYDVTFLKDVPDIYGKDIDLTARLLSVAQSQEIIMNKTFYMRLRERYNECAHKDQFPEVEKIFGPWPQTFEGFKEKVDIYKSMGRALS